METVDRDLLPRGCWPVLLTPLDERGGLDLPALARYVEWTIEQGAAGLFTAAMSSEVFELTPAERDELVAEVVRIADGRVPVVAAALSDGDPAALVGAARRVHERGAASVVLLAGDLAGADEDETTLRVRLKAIMAALPEVDLGLYECPKPYHRLLSTELLGWAASTGRFTFFKDTSLDPQVRKDRVAVTAGSRLRLYNAEACSLVESVTAGFHGFSGCVADVYPSLVARAVDLAGADAAEAGDLQRVLTAADHGLSAHWPASAKYVVGEMFGLGVTEISRMAPPLQPHAREVLRQFLGLVGDLVPRLAGPGGEIS